MAYRLGEYVTYGELFTTTHYGVYGFVVLRTEAEEAGGDHTFVRLELTGDPDPDLQNKHICFEPAEGSEIKYFDKSEHKSFQLQQYGATGTMTAQGWVRTLPCSVEEYMTRSRLGEPPPTEWKNRLYLEWYGPNGRTVIELPGAFVEVCTRERDEQDERDEGEWEPLPNLAPKPAEYRHGAAENDETGIEITEINRNGEIRTYTSADFPGEIDDFQRSLDAHTASVERAIGSGYDDDWEGRGDDEEEEDPLAETRLMDECLECGEETPLIRLLGGIDTLPHPDSLDDVAAETELKVLLGRMAMLGVALNVCDHCTPREAYRLLLERILPDSGVFEDLIGTHWVQHLMTHEYCDQCEAEHEAEEAYLDVRRN